MGKVLALGGIQQKIRAACDAGVKRLCVKVVSIRSERGLIKYAPFLLSALVKRSQTTLHTASIQLEVATCATTVATAATTAMTATVATTAMVAATPKATSPPNGIRSHKVDHHKEDHYA